MKLINILNEYSEGLIRNTIERWKRENPKIDETLARQIITRFDQIKNGLSSKINTLALSDELKSNNNYLNIDKYSFNDMIKLIRSIPENEDKIKKDAIQQFISSEKIEKAMASHYVIRFMNNKRNLKYAVENGTESGTFSKEEVVKFIPKHLMQGDMYLDPRRWSFQKLEHMLDALFPYQSKVNDESSSNTATTDADKIYDQNNFEVYKGDAQHKCVSYNPTQNGQKKYGWCIAQPGNSNYDYYRFQEGTNRMFYFCFDRDLPESNVWHAFVIHVAENNKKYWITNSKNSGDVSIEKWGDIKNQVEPSVWNKLKNLENLFKYIPPSKAEISSAALRGKKLSVRDFNELDYETKQQYVQSNAGNLSKEILETLDKELKNLAINYGQLFTYNQLKNNEGLLKRYAVFRFRHTNYGKTAIPLPFVKYLDEEAKMKYFETFKDSSLTAEYIQKYFGEKVLSKYINDMAKISFYIPSQYFKYIKDPKLKEYYNLYGLLFKNWSSSNDTNLSEDDLNNTNIMPEASVNPVPLTYSDWKELTSQQRQDIISFTLKAKAPDTFDEENPDVIIYYSVPFIIKNNGKDYVLLPSNKQNQGIYTDWVLSDTNGKLIKNLKGNITLNNNDIISGYPSDSEPRRIYNIDELKIDNKNIILKETQFDDWSKFSLQRKAGIID